jgi:hypothetical protein
MAATGSVLLVGLSRAMEYSERPEDRPESATIYAWNLDETGTAHLAVPDEVASSASLSASRAAPDSQFGTVATELDLEHDELPMFLIDSRTRRGQSGAPVFWHSSHGLIPVTLCGRPSRMSGSNKA